MLSNTSRGTIYFDSFYCRSNNDDCLVNDFVCYHRFSGRRLSAPCSTSACLLMQQAFLYITCRNAIDINSVRPKAFNGNTSPLESEYRVEKTNFWYFIHNFTIFTFVKDIASVL